MVEPVAFGFNEETAANNKAKHLVGMAQMLVKDFHSEVPGTLEELVKLPGVGRRQPMSSKV